MPGAAQSLIEGGGVFNGDVHIEGTNVVAERPTAGNIVLPGTVTPYLKLFAGAAGLAERMGLVNERALPSHLLLAETLETASIHRTGATVRPESVVRRSIDLAAADGVLRRNPGTPIVSLRRDGMVVGRVAEGAVLDAQNHTTGMLPGAALRVELDAGKTTELRGGALPDNGTGPESSEVLIAPVPGRVLTPASADTAAVVAENFVQPSPQESTSVVAIGKKAVVALLIELGKQEFAAASSTEKRRHVAKSSVAIEALKQLRKQRVLLPVDALTARWWLTPGKPAKNYDRSE